MRVGQYIRVNNQNLKPFVWTKRAEVILGKLRYCKAASVTQH
jgi:hypothetical protein